MSFQPRFFPLAAWFNPWRTIRELRAENQRLVNLIVDAKQRRSESARQAARTRAKGRAQQ